MSSPSTRPVEAGPDTICSCFHWWEEHDEDGCVAPGCECPSFTFDATATTPESIADRGGDPEAWPQWMKNELGPN